MIPLSIAASLLIFVGYFFQENYFSNERLAINYYQNSTTLNSFTKGNEDDSNLNRARFLVENKKFTEAINILTPLAKNNDLGIQANHLMGHAYFLQNDFAKASSKFKLIFDEKTKENFLKEEAKWYFILAQLALGKEDNSEFKSILSELASNNSFNAKELKERLN